MNSVFGHYAMSDDSRRKIMPFLFCAAFILFTLAMFLPSVSSSPNPSGKLVCENAFWAPGWQLLIMGWLGPIQGQFGWFANPLMIISMFLINRKSGIYFAGAAVALALLSRFTFTSTLNDVGKNLVCGFGWGYYLWVGCAVLVFLMTLLQPNQALDSASFQ